MVPRVFALASATSLAGLVAASTISGCSDDDNNAASSDAGNDRRIPTPVDDGGGTNACFSDTAVDATKFTYKAPTVRPGACTTTDVANIIKYVDETDGATFQDFQREVNEKYAKSCAECIFGDVGADTWAPILTEEGKVVDLNSSGCVQIVSTRGDACGRAHWQWNACIDEACKSCEPGSVDEDECSTAVQAGACKAATDTLASACGQNINTFITACRGTYGFDAWIRRQCVGTPSDAGTDAGDAGDAGDASPE
jgi:hypothetical protein